MKNTLFFVSACVLALGAYSVAQQFFEVPQPLDEVAQVDQVFSQSDSADEVEREETEFDRRCSAVFPITDMDGRRWGAIDGEGRVLVPLSYDDASRGYAGPASTHCWTYREVGQEGVLLVSPDEWCYISVDGPHSTKPLYDDVLYVFNFGESLFGINSSKEPFKPSFVYDPFDKWAPPENVYPYDRFSEGRVAVSKGELFGFADRTGKVVIELQFDGARHFNEGLAAVEQNGKWGFIDQDGNIVIPLQYDIAGIFSEGIALVGMNGQRLPHFIDKAGKRLHDWPPGAWRHYDNYGWFAEGLKEERVDTVVSETYTQPHFGFLNTRGEWVLEPRWHNVTSFVDGLAAVVAPKSGRVVLEGPDIMLDVEERDGSGYIDVSGQLKIPLPLASTLRTFQRGLAWIETPRVEDRGGVGYIDHKGNWVWRCDGEGIP